MAQELCACLDDRPRRKVEVTMRRLLARFGVKRQTKNDR
jgi:hypothetical protein